MSSTLPIAILLDEHIKLQTAYRLMEQGYDVVPARDRGLLDWDDWDLIKWCREQRRAICTRNGPDFEREHEHCRQRGDEHFGVLVVGNDWSQEEIYWALRQHLEASPDPALLMNQVIRLPKAAEEFIRKRSDG
jgi:predicted nuclease of predicted toxin-antitoxin system